MRSLIGGILARGAPLPEVPRGSQGVIGSLMSSVSNEGFLRATKSTGTLYQIVNTFAQSVAGAPWELYRKQAPQGENGPVRHRQIVQRHAARDLWARPNPFFTRQKLIETVQQHVELVGEGYLLLVRYPGLNIPSEIWPIRPTRMEPVPHPTEWLTGWVYRGPDGEQVPLGRKDVIQIRVPNPDDPYRGLGPVQSILADLESVRLSAEWNRNFFLNGAKPGGVIEVPEELQDEDFDRLEQQFRDRHQGVGNAHRVAILENGAVWKDRSASHDDMQFVEMRKASREVIREAFGISKTMLGLTEEVNRATAEAAMMVFARDRKKPRLARWREALNTELLPLFGAPGERVEFDFDPEIPEDRVAESTSLKARSESVSILAAAGYDPKQVLAVCGLPPMEHVQPPKPAAPAAPGTPPPDPSGGSDE